MNGITQEGQTGSMETTAESDPAEHAQQREPLWSASCWKSTWKCQSNGGLRGGFHLLQVGCTIHITPGTGLLHDFNTEWGQKQLDHLKKVWALMSHPRSYSETRFIHHYINEWKELSPHRRVRGKWLICDIELKPSWWAPQSRDKPGDQKSAKWD